MTRFICLLFACMLLVTLFVFSHDDCDRCVQTDDGFWGCQGGYPSGRDECVPAPWGGGCYGQIICPGGKDPN